MRCSWKRYLTLIKAAPFPSGISTRPWRVGGYGPVYGPKRPKTTDLPELGRSRRGAKDRGNRAGKAAGPSACRGRL